MNDQWMPELMTFADLDELTDAVAELANSRVLQRIDTRGIFHLALTGGESGGLVTRKLVSRWNAQPERFYGLHLWWGDERFLPVGSKERNATVLLENLREDSPIHIHQVLPSDSNLSLSVAAKRYAADLTSIDMDLTLLGVGPDGHVASIFPNHAADETNGDVLAVIDAPKNPPMRVSFSFAKINASNSVWLMASGASKRHAVAQILGNEVSIPATLVHGQMETLLFVDSDSMVNE